MEKNTSQGGVTIKNLKNYQTIINSKLFQREKDYIQHGDTTVYEHSLMVAEESLKLARLLHLKIDEESLIKGALLHDYFLYDWHVKEDYHRFHGIKHPIFSRNNAKRDFGLNKKEENMILSHMFPLMPILPKYKESWILFLADKICATKETVSYIYNNNRLLNKIKEFVFSE